MPKRKWNRLHDESAIADELHHRSRNLREQRAARATIREAVDESSEPTPPEQSEPPDEPPDERPKDT